jgi:hypothetical protein
MNENRYDVTLSKTGERTQHTFTWGATRVDAARCMRGQMAQCPDLWEGWSFALADSATGVPANVVRCIECTGAIRAGANGPHACAECGRGVYPSDGLNKPGEYWDDQAGWLVSVQL